MAEPILINQNASWLSLLPSICASDVKDVPIVLHSRIFFGEEALQGAIGRFLRPVFAVIIFFYLGFWIRSLAALTSDGSGGMGSTSDAFGGVGLGDASTGQVADPFGLAQADAQPGGSYADQANAPDQSFDMPKASGSQISDWDNTFNESPVADNSNPKEGMLMLAGIWQYSVNQFDCWFSWSICGGGGYCAVSSKPSPKNNDFSNEVST